MKLLLRSLGASREQLFEGFTKGWWKTEPAEAEIRLGFEWKMTSRGSKDMKYLQSKGSKACRCKRWVIWKTQKWHKSKYSKYSNHFMGQNVKSGWDVVEADWEERAQCLARKVLSYSQPSKMKGKTNLDINVGRQRQAGSRKADLSSI